jgi:hypothetical protein
MTAGCGIRQRSNRQGHAAPIWISVIPKRVEAAFGNGNRLTYSSWIDRGVCRGRPGDGR